MKTTEYDITSPDPVRYLKKYLVQLIDASEIAPDHVSGYPESQILKLLPHPVLEQFRKAARGWTVALMEVTPAAARGEVVYYTHDVEDWLRGTLIWD